MKRNRLALLVLLGLIALSAAVCVFSFAFVTWQGWARQGRLQTLQDAQRQDNEARLLQLEYRDWQRLPQQLLEFRKKHVRSMDEFAGFRRALDGHLAANGLQPSRIDLSFGARRNQLRRVTLKFSVAGSYRSLKKFIFDMEAKTKMHYFSSVHLSAASDQVKAAFVMEVYIGD
jgi:hypothetical protein